MGNDMSTYFIYFNMGALKLKNDQGHFYVIVLKNLIKEEIVLTCY